MPLPLVQVHCLTQIFSPFSGLPADGDKGPNQQDDTLLFVYYGDATQFAYVSSAVLDAVKADPDELEVEDLQEALSMKGGFIMEVDTDWNGVNYYGFAPKS